MKTDKLKQLKNPMKNYFVMLIGLVIYTFGYSAFMLPNKLTGGGIAGLSTILYYGTSCPVGISNFVLNAILILIGAKTLGKRFAINTIFCTAISSALFGLFQSIITEPLIANDLLSNAVLGAGLGLVSSTDGFKDALFGEADENGVREGGIIGALKEGVITPLTDFAIDIKDHLVDFIKDEWIAPIKKAIDRLVLLHSPRHTDLDLLLHLHVLVLLRVGHGNGRLPKNLPDYHLHQQAQGNCRPHYQRGTPRCYGSESLRMVLEGRQGCAYGSCSPHRQAGHYAGNQSGRPRRIHFYR